MDKKLIMAPVSNQSTQNKIDRNQANLPLPEQPPVASDWQSMDESKVNVSSGRVESHTGTGPHATTGTRGPPANLETAEDEMSKIGRQGKDNLSGPPKDAKY